MRFISICNGIVPEKQKHISKYSTAFIYISDYNINLLNSSTHEHTGEFVDILYSNEFLPLISRPTFISSNSATLIDNIMTNCLDNLNSSINGILVTDISDHYPVFHVNCSLTVEEFDTCSVRRVYSERSKQAFAEAISETNCCEIYNASDTQESFERNIPTENRGCKIITKFY